jgi:hypothetical protein
MLCLVIFEFDSFPLDPFVSCCDNNRNKLNRAGEEAIKRANEQRFSERLANQYEQYRQQRLANSESECRKMISDITTRLTQACTALHYIVPYTKIFDTIGRALGTSDSICNRHVRLYSWT